MRKSFLTISCLLFATLFSTAMAQDNPVAHMNEFAEREKELSTNYLSYMSEIAHGGKARKMERRRNELISSVKKALGESARIKPYKGDASLRDAYRSYWSVLLSVLTEDYAKIMDMEEVAERSYDAMEAYLLIQEKAEERLDDAFNQVADAYNLFAANHNVTLAAGKSTKLEKRLRQLGRANAYLNRLFLIYFKSTVQEQLALEALNNRDINGLEQNRGSLSKYAAEGLAQLDTLKPYQNDRSLISACQKVLQFQQNESASMSVYADFLVKNDEFGKIKRSFDQKGSKRTQADVDAFNKAVAEQNKAVDNYNKINGELNKQREKVYTNWEATKRRFMEQYYPRKV